MSFITNLLRVFCAACILIASNAVSGDYCNSTGYGDSTKEWIQKVELNSGFVESVNSAYSDYTSTVLTALSPGETYTLYVTGYVNYSSPLMEYVTAWIDFDGNEYLNDSGEELVLGGFKYTGSHLYSKDFTVPSNAVGGNTRMRVIIKYYLDPLVCLHNYRAEVEDYTIYIDAPYTTTTSSTSTSSSSSSSTSSSSSSSTSSSSSSSTWTTSTTSTTTPNACYCGSPCLGTNGCTNNILADSCSGASSCDGQDDIEDITLTNVDTSCGSVNSGETLHVDAFVECYNSNDRVEIWYHNGTAWRQVYSDPNCDYPGTKGHYYTSFTVDGTAATQYVRVVIGYEWSGGSSCYTGTYGDVDDLAFNVYVSSTTSTTTSTSSSTSSSMPASTTTIPPTTTTWPYTTTTSIPATSSTTTPVSTTSTPAGTTTSTYVSTTQQGSTTSTSTSLTSSTSSSTTTSSTTSTTMEGQVTVSRDLPISRTPGSNFTVRLTMNVNEASLPASIGVTEYYPAGWTVSESSPAAVEKGDRLEWICSQLTSCSLEDQEITYKVHIPLDANGTYAFTGTVYSNQTTTNITGDASFTVNSIVCDLVGNYPSCDEITLSEVIEMVNEWFVGYMGLNDTVDLVYAWATS